MKNTIYIIIALFVPAAAMFTEAQAGTSPMETGYATVSDAPECPGDFTVDAGENQTYIIEHEHTYCPTLHANVSGGVEPVSVMWSTGEANPSVYVCPDESTTYLVTATDAMGCVVTDSVRVCTIDLRCGRTYENPLLNRLLVCYTSPLQPYYPDLDLSRTFCVNARVAKLITRWHNWSLGPCNADMPCGFEEDVLAKRHDVRQLDAAQAEGLSVDARAYPNPFSTSATIRFASLRDDYAILSVYNMAGQEVSVLYEGPVEAGTPYEFTFESNDLPDGMYLYRLQTRQGGHNAGKIILRR